MHGKDALKGFEFEQDGVFDDDVGEVALVQAYVLVDDGERNFAFELQVVVLQFPAEAVMVDGLEKAGAEFSVRTLMPRPMMRSVRAASGSGAFIVVRVSGVRYRAVTGEAWAAGLLHAEGAERAQRSQRRFLIGAFGPGDSREFWLSLTAARSA